MANNKETKTEIHIGNKSPLGESMILTVVMVCCMASVLMILIPTALYHGGGGADVGGSGGAIARTDRTFSLYPFVLVLTSAIWQRTLIMGQRGSRTNDFIERSRLFWMKCCV
ncbi:hypothetical protein M0804_008111 [Polistes exclamans]|nr:hypothetical protein M0804_008111 [Polistes exclamans]